MRLRIDEAIALTAKTGKKVKKKDIAERLYPNVSKLTRQQNMTYLCSGKQKYIKIEWVQIICKMCGCSPNFLFGIED